VAPEPARIPGTIRFAEAFELDARAYELRRLGRVVKLERIPMEVLLLLVEQKGELVTREQIVEKVWGREVYLDTDNSINGAIRKLRQALRDDPVKPRVIQTVTGKGYRFIAAIEPAAAAASLSPVSVADPTPGKKPEAPVERLGATAPLRRWPVLLGLSLTLIAVLAIYLQRARPRPGPEPAGRRLMLAVLPFENLTGDPAQEYFSDGLTE
jgi:DNA-binding winged helix-turn-helix (wHTH) protein